MLGNLVGRLFDGLNLTGPPKPPRPSTGGSGGGSGGGRNIQVIPVGTPRIIASDADTYEAVFKFQILVPKEETESRKVKFNSYAILENGNAEKEPPIGVQIPEIVSISMESKKIVLTKPIEIDGSMNMKFLEVTVSGPQGVGTTCLWEVVD